MLTTIKDEIKQSIINSLKNIFSAEKIDFSLVIVEDAKISEYDLTSNIAFRLASVIKKSPVEISNLIIDEITKKQTQKNKKNTFKGIAERGYLNFSINDWVLYEKLKAILAKKSFGKINIGKSQKILLEYLSANPTGPLTAGNSRGGFIGDVLANVFIFLGYKVDREYYINDYGKQVEILGKSVELRYRELLGKKIVFPKDFYQAQYIIDFAEEIIKQDKDKWLKKTVKERVKYFSSFAINSLVNEIQNSLKSAGVYYDNWFSETRLHESNFVRKTAKDLLLKKYAYKKGKAVWFNAKKFGDEKDRVIVRSNGNPTYLLSDIAYHRNKFERGYEKVIDVWGADHHGYVRRLKASMDAFDFPEKLEIILYQLVTLKENGKEIKMSKRKGTFITLQEIIDMVGKDAVRFFFISKANNNHLDLNINLIKEKSQQNPLFYTQYAYARACSVIKKADLKDFKLNYKNINFNALSSVHEKYLIKEMIKFEEIIIESAKSKEVYKLIQYLTTLASLFHIYYEKEKIITDDKKIRQARLCLIKAFQAVLLNVFKLVGINAPEKM